MRLGNNKTIKNKNSKVDNLAYLKKIFKVMKTIRNQLRHAFGLQQSILP